MRRIWALALVIAAIPAAAAFVPLLAGGVARCAMTCHGGASMAAGASCCLLGADGATMLASCQGSRDGVPPVPVCRMHPPNLSAALERPLLALFFGAMVAAVLIFRPSEPLDPVPLALS